MKKLLFLLLAGAVLHTASFGQNTFPSTGAAGIGTIAPNASSLLDITSTNKGVLIPRMTKAQRDAIPTPVEGLLIYQTNSTAGFYYYDGGAWKAISSKGANTSLSNLSATAINENLLPAADNTKDLGSSTTSWKDIYADGFFYMDGTKFLDNTGDNLQVGNTGNITNTGTFNTFIGTNSGKSNTTGNYNTSTGYDALTANTFGTYNTAYGYSSLSANTSGTANTAHGVSALKYNTTGSLNIAMGYAALRDNTIGQSNTALGYAALSDNISGTDNVAVGTFTMLENTSGSYNTTVGSGSMKQNTTGKYNTATGYQALYANTTGHDNVVIGYDAMLVNTAGGENIAIGSQSMKDNTTGSNNTAMGFLSLQSNTTGGSNIAIGTSALSDNTTGHSNTVTGTEAGFSNQTGTDNCFYGRDAGNENISGNNNAFFGAQAGQNTTASNNAFFGFDAGGSNSSGSNNTYLGYSAEGGATVTNATAIGYQSNVTASNTFVFGDGNVTKWGFGKNAASGNIIEFANTTAKLTTGGAWTNASDIRLKDQVEKLDRKDILDRINQLEIPRWHYMADKQPLKHIGPMAQQFHELFGVGDDTTISTIDPAGIALLGIQALEEKLTDQESTIKMLEDENEAQLKRMNEQQRRIEELQVQLQQLLSSVSSSNDGAIKISTAEVESKPVLGQNIPNPFDNSTIIPFRIPKGCSSATIIISEAATGRMITAIPVSCDETHAIVEAGSLAAGTYQYTLIIDGKQMESRQMQLIR
ncbi:MAG TPA: tail fiber domain-containing protein [Chitinophagales bacterium]|nr:tail fiber domain-containing protein [Chitinophagales bacterium]